MAMKKILYLLLAVILFAGCEDLEDNSPSLQGTIDHDFFKANDVRAEKFEDGSYTIQGYTRDETLTLHINKAQLGTYSLGEGQSNFASFEDMNGNVYSTSPSGSGEIVLTDRCISCGWLTGTFRFEAILPGVDTITVHRGIYHEVNFLEGGLIGDGGEISAGTLIAIVDENNYEAVAVSAEVVGSTLIIEGAVDTRIIRIEVPSNTTTGNYSLPLDGYRATYTDQNSIEEEAISGSISVNFHIPEDNKILIFFNFETENHSITEGQADIDY